MSDEFKPRLRRIDYKAGKMFPKGVRVYRTKLKKVELTEQEKKASEIKRELDALESEYDYLYGKSVIGVPYEVGERKRMAYLKKRITVLRDKLNQNRSDVNGKER